MDRKKTADCCGGRCYGPSTNRDFAGRSEDKKICGGSCVPAAQNGYGARYEGMSPCAAAILERERQERERRRRERKEKERIEREKKELERREKDLKRREPYMCPGEANLEKTAIKLAKKESLARQKKREREKATPQSPITPPTPIGLPPVTTFREQELRGGVYYNRCDCSRRNGLQNDCQRSECQGRPACLTNPPMCIPSGGIGYISPCYPVCDPPCYD
jgi:hypothetical protein